MMKKRITSSFITIVCCTAYCAFETKALPIISVTEAMPYLTQFGYPPPAVNPTGSEKSVTDGMISPTISKLTTGINITSKMNVHTAEMMTLRGCGVEERLGPSRGTRAKRYALHASKWERKNLTYRISKYPKSLNSKLVDEEIRRAFALWSEYTDLTFSLKNGTVDIEIRFERGPHGDGMPFDGRQGEILAHAFYPWVGGDVHFDEDEEWTMNSNRGTNLFQVAAHEFGHSLGLGHSITKSAVMTPAYKSYDQNFALDRDDIKGIQAIYGPRTTEEVPQLCADTQIATVFETRKGHTYAFKGKYYWRLTADGIASGYPKLIARRWNRLRGNIDAVVVQPNGSTLFFKGSKYWRYVGNRMDGNYPREISKGFRRTSGDVSARVRQSIRNSRRRSLSELRMHCSPNRFQII